MKKENRCETAARTYEEKKRMKKLAGIQENRGGIRDNIKSQIDKLANDIKNIANELRGRNQ